MYRILLIFLLILSSCASNKGLNSNEEQVAVDEKKDNKKDEDSKKVGNELKLNPEILKKNKTRTINSNENIQTTGKSKATTKSSK